VASSLGISWCSVPDSILLDLPPNPWPPSFLDRPSYFHDGYLTCLTWYPLCQHFFSAMEALFLHAWVSHAAWRRVHTGHNLFKFLHGSTQ
jgi:hypothetical protein